MSGPDRVRRREDAWLGGTLSPSISYTSRWASARASAADVCVVLAYVDVNEMPIGGSGVSRHKESGGEQQTCGEGQRRGAYQWVERETRDGRDDIVQHERRRPCCVARRPTPSEPTARPQPRLRLPDARLAHRREARRALAARRGRRVPVDALGHAVVECVIV